MTAVQEYEMTLNEAVVTEIRAELSRRGWSQEQLGARLGHNQQWVQRRLASGARPSFADIEQLAGVFGMTVEELVTNARLFQQRVLPRLDSNQQPTDSWDDLPENVVSFPRRPRLHLVANTS